MQKAQRARDVYVKNLKSSSKRTKCSAIDHHFILYNIEVLVNLNQPITWPQLSISVHVGLLRLKVSTREGKQGDSSHVAQRAHSHSGDGTTSTYFRIQLPFRTKPITGAELSR